MDRETERPLGAAAEEGTRAVRGLAAAAQDILGELEAALGGAHARQGGGAPQPPDPCPSSQLTSLQAEYLKRYAGTRTARAPPTPPSLSPPLSPCPPDPPYAGPSASQRLPRPARHPTSPGREPDCHFYRRGRRSQRVLELVAECETLKGREGAAASADLSEAELEERVLQLRREVEKKNYDLRTLLRECYLLMGDVKLMQAGQPPPPGPPGASSE